MDKIKIYIFHTGEVCVAPALPFGGENCSALKASGLFDKKENRLWLPVSSYLIDYNGKKILFDCGWHRNMSPAGKFDKKAQIKSLGSVLLYKVNQGKVPKGEAIDEQLLKLGIRPEELDLVLLSHLDCDHANGLKLVADAKKILVSSDEMEFTKKGFVNKIRYNPAWWEGTKIQVFGWNGTEGPAQKSYDVFGDGNVLMVNIPGHSAGLCALKVKNAEGKFVLLFSDGGYATKSWKEMITSGISADKKAQKKSLEWIRSESLDKNCAASLANHDPDVKPGVIEL